MLKRWLLACLMVLGCSASNANFAIFQATASLTPPVFTHVPIGGGGAVIGISSVPSLNLLLAKTDQYGCYKSVSNSQWVQLDTVSAMPSDGVAVLTAAGAPIANGADECIADASGNVWMGTNGSIYLSTNSGTSFGTTCYPAQGPSNSQGQNQPIKSMGHTIAVDPNNSSVVYMSTPSAGLEFSKDQGVTCSLISTSSIPLASSVGGAGGGHIIAFDTSAGTTVVGGQTRTAIVYATSYGHGVYKSTDGGVTWAIQNATGMPTTHWYMVSDNHGNLYFVDNSSNNQSGVAFKYNGSNTWTNLGATIPTPTTAVAVDPNNCSSAATCHVAFVISGGNGTGTALTVNGGGSWNIATGTKTFTTTDVPWISTWITTFGLFAGGGAFDNSGNVYTGGEGVFFTTPPTSGTAITFTSQTKGIEEGLIGAVVTSPNTSGRVVISTWDINCFTLSQPYTSLPSTGNRGCFNTNQPSLQRTNIVDWASSSPSTFVALTDNQQGYNGGTYTNYSGISTDGGQTWGTALAAPSGVTSGGLMEGCMAASSPTNIVWAPTDGSGGNVAPSFTTNGGASATYTQISVTGATGGWPYRNYLTSKTCAADRALANTFYFYNWNMGDGSGDAIIKCTSSGASCAIQSRPGFNQQFIPTLKTVPGQAGYLFFSSGQAPFVDGTPGGFWYSTNGGANFTSNQIANFTMTIAFGFGAPFPGHTFPAIVAVGFYNHVWGIWQSVDWDGAKTWQKIGDYPMGLPVNISDIDGDKTIPNVFYYGSNSGVFCSSPSTAYCNNSF